MSEKYAAARKVVGLTTADSFNSGMAGSGSSNSALSAVVQAALSFSSSALPLASEDLDSGLKREGGQSGRCR